MQRLLSSMPKYRWQEMRIISVLDQQQISSVLVARGMQTSAVSQQRDAPTNDPFTQQLQQRTEAELAELLAATQAKKQMQQQQQQGTSASGTNVADNTEDEDEVEVGRKYV